MSEANDESSREAATSTDVLATECMKERWRGRCCCNCRWHIEDFHHCTTAWELRSEKGGCVCDEHKGWICMAPEMEHAYSGWTEHGLCEMHDFAVAN